MYNIQTIYDEKYIQYLYIFKIDIIQTQQSNTTFDIENLLHSEKLINPIQILRKTRHNTKSTQKKIRSLWTDIKVRH